MAAGQTGRTEKIDLTSGPLMGHLVRMAWPTVLGIVLQSLYSMADTFWLGRLGEGKGVVAVASPGVVRPVLFIAVSLGFGLSMGGTALVAQFTGAGEHRRADRAAGQTLLLLSAMGVLAALPIVLLAPGILRLMRVPPGVVASASAYLRIFIAGLPFMAFSMAYASVLRALGDTITAVVIVGATNLLNFALDPVLIFGWGGLPALGVRGAALASAIGQVLSAFGCYVCMRRGRAGLHVGLAEFVPDWTLIGRIIAVGVPAGVGSAMNSVGLAIFQTIINSFGTAVVGAFTIGFQVLHFFDAPMHGVAHAAAPIVGQALGAGKVALARRAVRMSVITMALILLAPTAFLMLRGQWVARIFIQDADVIAESGRFFRIVPASTYFFGVVMVLMAAFYGSGHTRPVMAISFVRVFGVRIPAGAMLAFWLHLGSVGAYLGMVAGNVAGALLSVFLFLKGGWETGVVGGLAQGSDEDEGEPPPPAS